MNNQIIKVCVRIPSAAKSDLMAFAAKLRGADKKVGARAPGWDAKAIHKIARSKYGGLLELFEHHGWPERGSDMMRQVQSRIKKTYGSVDEFVAANHGSSQS